MNACGVACWYFRFAGSAHWRLLESAMQRTGRGKEHKQQLKLIHKILALEIYMVHRMAYSPSGYVLAPY